MDIEDIFATPLQVKILKIFLCYPQKLFSTRMLAKLINSSPSSIISRLKALAKLGIIKILEVNRLRLYQLNLDNALAKILLEFYQKIKNYNSTNYSSSC